MLLIFGMLDMSYFKENVGVVGLMFMESEWVEVGGVGDKC